MKYIVIPVTFCLFLLLAASCGKSEHSSSTYTRSYRGFYSVTYKGQTRADTIKSIDNTDYDLSIQQVFIDTTTISRKYFGLYLTIDSFIEIQLSASRGLAESDTGRYKMGIQPTYPYLTYGMCNVIDYATYMSYNLASGDTNSSWVYINSYKQGKVSEVNGTFKTLINVSYNDIDTVYGTFDIFK